MAFKDYSDAFNYTEKIALDFAKDIKKTIINTSIKQLKEMTAGQLSCGDSGLESIWEEICVQLQTDYSAMWDLYDDLVYNFTRKSVYKLKEHELAALYYDFRLIEDDNEYVYDIDEITESLLHEIYEIATNYRSDNVIAFLENEDSL